MLHHCYLIYRNWKSTIAEKINNILTYRKLEHIRNELEAKGIDIHQSSPKWPASYHLRHTKTILKAQRKLYTHRQKQHLTFGKGVMVLEGKKSYADAIKTAQHAERRAHCFQKYHTITKQQRQNGGPEYVFKPNQDGSHRRIQQPEGIAVLLSQRKHDHLLQADGTPLTRRPLSRRLQFMG
jgi:hypothetical protein